MKRKNNNSSIQSGIAGAGGGTLLLLLTKNIPDTILWKPYLVLIAPSLSVSLSILWKKVYNYVDNFVNKRTQNAVKNEFRISIQKLLDNPNISEGRKEQLREQLAEFELKNIALLAEYVALELNVNNIN